MYLSKKRASFVKCQCYIIAYKRYSLELKVIKGTRFNNENRMICVGKRTQKKILSSRWEPNAGPSIH